MSKQICDALLNIKEKRPCVQSISNIVTARDCANVLLAVYASPFMAHHKSEVSQIAANADALVVSLGATDDYEAIELSIKAANSNNHPVVVDPVGVGASTYRKDFCKKLINDYNITCIRANASEIKALLLDTTTIKGLDSLIDDDVETLAKTAAAKFDTIVAITGAVDVIADKNSVITLLDNGTPKLKRITGAGCMLSCIVGAFLSANEQNANTVSLALELLGDCAKQADDILAKENRKGTMSFENYMIDAISTYLD